MVGADASRYNAGYGQTAIAHDKRCKICEPRVLGIAVEMMSTTDPTILVMIVRLIWQLVLI